MPAISRHRLIKKVLLLPTWLILMSASMFSQTSADPATGAIQLRIKDEKLKVQLEAAGVETELYPNGTLKHLVFHQLGHYYDVHFHDLGIAGEEVASEVKRFQLIDNHRLLDGPSQTFSDNGELLSETNWERGRLHGPQRFYNQYNQLIQERFYDLGHPVGSWRINYGDGTLAALLEFPKSRSLWKGTHRDLGPTASTLKELKPTKTLSATEIWYNQNGVKQKEREYRLFKRGASIMVEATGVTRSYDHDGKVIRETKLWNGSGEEIRHLSSESAHYKQRIIWINGGMFRDEWVRLPQGN